MPKKFNTTDIFECRRSGVASETLRGIVAAQSSTLLLINTLKDGWFFDGYAVIRVDDITEYRFFRAKDSLEKRVQKLLGYAATPPDIPLDLSSMRSVAQSLFEAGKMFSLEKEVSCKNTLWMGKIQRITAGSLYLAELDCEARWSGGHRHSIAAITRIGFDNRYIRFYEKLSAGSAAGDPPLEQ